MAEKNYYEIFNVPMNADTSEIKKAYRKLAKKFHPDINKDPGSDELFMMIQEAYETLTDENARKEYNKTINKNKSKKEQSESSSDESKTASNKAQNKSKSNQHADNYSKTVYYHFTENHPKFTRYRPIKRFNFLSVIRKIIGVLFLIIIPLLLKIGEFSWNQIILYYGWILLFFIVKKILFGLTNFGLFIWFVVSLFQGNSINVLYSLGSIVVLGLIYLILSPEEFQ